MGEWAGARLRIASKTTDERVGVGVTRISEGRRVGTLITSEVECPRPLPTRRFTIQYAFVVDTKLVSVISTDDREIIGKGRLDIIVADFPPAIQPVDICRCDAEDAVPAGRSGNGGEAIVTGEDLRCRIAQCAPLQTFNKAIRWDEPFGIMTHPKIELVDNGRTNDANPVRRPAVVLIE